MNKVYVRENQNADSAEREKMAMKIAEQIVGPTLFKRGVFYVDNILQFMNQNNVLIPS